MKIVATVSAKGGVGKTTVVANLAAALARTGYLVTVIDLDPQNALRLHFGLDPASVGGLARAALAGADLAALSEIRESTTAGLAVVSYGRVNEDDRRRFERLLDDDIAWLGQRIAHLGLGPDDIVILDTPPGPSVYMRQALAAAHLALVVTLPDAASYAALPLMAGLVGTYCTPRSDFLGTCYLVNQVDGSRALARDVLQVLRARLGAQLLGTVQDDQAVSEALASDQPVLDYDLQGQATHDFLQCARSLAARLR